MNQDKAAYFDTQIDAPWANTEYGSEDLAKLNRVFALVEVGEGMHVLEPGCGTGRLTEILTERIGPSGHVLACDISRKMVEAARHRLAGRENREIVQAAVEDLPLEDSMFDIIMCHQVFPHLDDREKALSRFARALKPTGKLIVMHFVNYGQINDRHRKAGTAVENDMMPSADEMKRLFTSAGFVIDVFTDDEMGYLMVASPSRFQTGSI